MYDDSTPVDEERNSVDELVRAVAAAPPRAAPSMPAKPAPDPVSPPVQEVVDTSPFELRRWGLRFVTRDVELSYREWHLRNAIPYTRIGMILSLANWALTLIGFAVLTRQLWTAAAWILGVPIPVILFALACTHAQRLLRWMHPATALANTLAGLTIVGLTASIFALPDGVAAVAMFVAFFGFTIFRMRPLLACAAVVPYLVVSEMVLARWYARGHATLQQFGMDTVLTISAAMTGVLVSLIADRISREGYRQQRIIELQQDTIARLQQAEIQRQVAERSRDLSHALARLADRPRAARFAVAEIVEDRYRIVRSLGAGGMGQVHEVERLTDRRRLALKVLTGVPEPRALARFAREAQLAAELDHPNVVPAIDIGVTGGGTLFLVMPLVAGRSLSHARDRYGDPAWARPVIAQIAAALVAMHERGIVHRDLKPSNVMLDGDHVKVTDFGIANVFARGEPTPDGETQLAPAATLTRSGHFVGTPLYMAPEVADPARDASPEADVFSLGVIAYELLSRKLPHVAPPIYERLAGRVPEPPPPLARLVPDLPPALAGMIDRCLAHTSGARPSARELATMFQQLPAKPD